MLNETDLEDSSIGWLKKSIADESLNYYEHSTFKNLRQIGRGSSGIIIRANWKIADGFVVLKTFNNDKTTLSEIVNEVLLIL